MKKWLIGCGGCLGVVLIIVIAVGGFLWWGADSLVKGSQGAATGFFGEELPSGYNPLLGMDVDDKGTSFVMMMNMKTANVLMGIKTPLEEGELEVFTSGDTEKLEELIGEAMRSGSSSSDVRDMELLGMDNLATQKGDILALRFRTTTSSRTSAPLLCSLIPFNDGKLKLMILMTQAESTNPDAQFEDEFDWMLNHLTDVIDETTVADGSVSIAVPAG